MNENHRVHKGISTGGQSAARNRAESGISLTAVAAPHASGPAKHGDSQARRGTTSEMAVALVEYVNPKWGDSKGDVKWTKNLLLTVDFQQTQKRLPTSSEENGSEENRLSRWLQRQRHASSSPGAGELKVIGREAILDAILPGWRRTAYENVDSKENPDSALKNGIAAHRDGESQKSTRFYSNPQEEDTENSFVLGDSANPGEANMFSANRIATVITASAATLALLAGCSAGPLDLDIAVDTDGTATVPVEAVTDEPVVDIETLSSGDQLTKDQALDINRDFTTGVRGYQMADESWVAIRKESPLPEAVKAEIAVGVAGLANAAPLGDTRDAMNALGNARYNTGRSFLAVGPVQASCSEGGFGPNVWSYGVHTDKTYVEFCVSREEAISFAQNWIANKADAGQWELIVD